MNTRTINDGGPAFPVPNDANVNDQEGMTLRDYFAAKAMTGICASSPTDNFTDQRIAREAYNLADAMLKARSE